MSTDAFDAALNAHSDIVDAESALSQATPQGLLTARAESGQDYPAISIFLNGLLVATVEYTHIDKCVRTVAYNDYADDPDTIVLYNAE